MSGMREISEQKANALNFLNTVLSTNQRPRFWALNQWEASLQFLRFWLTYKIKLQSQQSDSHLSNQTAIWAIRLQSSYTVVWLWRLQSDCRDAVKLRRLYTNYWDCKHNWCNLTAMQEDCSLIAEIAVWLWRLPSGMSGMREISERKANALNFLNPVLSTNQRPQFWALNQSQQSDSHLSDQTAISAIRLQSSYIAVWLWRLQSDCGDCSLIAEIAEIKQLTYTYPNPPYGLRHVARCFILIAEIALWLLRLQSNCGDCTLITEIAITIRVI